MPAAQVFTGLGPATLVHLHLVHKSGASAQAMQALAHEMARRALATLEGVAPENVGVGHNRLGQPHPVPLQALPLASASALSRWSLSISHIGQWAAVACTEGMPVGVDIECDDPHRFAPMLAPEILTQTERTRVQANRSLAPQLCEAWCRKEAVLKACGLGLNFPVNALGVEPAALRPPSQQSNLSLSVLANDAMVPVNAPVVLAQLHLSQVAHSIQPLGAPRAFACSPDSSPYQGVWWRMGATSQLVVAVAWPAQKTVVQIKTHVHEPY